MGIFDNSFNQPGGGVLSFDDRWGDVLKAIQGGQFDPQGQNGRFLEQSPWAPPQPSPQMNMNPTALAYAPQGSQSGAGAPLQPPMGPPSPGSSPSGGGGSFLGGIGNFLNNNPLTLMALGGGIAKGGIAGGLEAAVPAAALEQKQRKEFGAQIGIYQAVKQAGGSEAQARAAMLNPEVFKALAPSLFDTTPKLQKIGTDILGREVMGGVQSVGGELYVNGKKFTGGASGGAGGAVSGVDENKPIYDQLPKGAQSVVDAMLAGKQQPPSTIAQKTPYWATLIEAAHQKAQESGSAFDATNWTERNTFARGMGSMLSNSYGGQVLKSGTVVKHLGDAQDALKVLNEGGILAPSNNLNSLNAVKSYIRDQLGNDPKYQSALGKYDIAKKGLAGELEQLLSGSHGAESSKQYWMNKLDFNGGPAKVTGGLEEVGSLMYGRLSNVAQAKQRAYGGEVDPISLLGKDEQKIWQQIKSGAAQERGDTTQPAPAALQTRTIGGKTYIKQGNQWFEK